MARADLLTSSPTLSPAQPRRTLARAATGSFALNVFNTLATVTITAVLARTMDVSQFGGYSWVIATVTLLSVPAVMGADRLLVRDVSVYIAARSFGMVRGLMRWVLTLVGVTSVGIASALAIVLITTSANGLAANIGAVIIGLIALPAISTARVLQAALVGGDQIVRAQLPELLIRPLTLLGLIAGALILLGPGLTAETVLALYLFSVTLSLAVSAWLVWKRLIPRLDRAPARTDARTWTPAVVALALLSGSAILNSQMGVFLLGLLDGAEPAGLYAVAQRGALLIAFPLLAVNVALAPAAARLWAAGSVAELQRVVTRSARAVLVLSAPAALVMIVFGGPLLGLVFGSYFSGAAATLLILSVGQLANVATGSVATLLIMGGYQWRAGIGIVAGMFVNIVVASFLIPSLHAEGAAIAAASSLVVSNSIHVIIARRSMGIDSTALGSPPRRAGATP